MLGSLELSGLSGVIRVIEVTFGQANTSERVQCSAFDMHSRQTRGCGHEQPYVSVYTERERETREKRKEKREKRKEKREKRR